MTQRRPTVCTLCVDVSYAAAAAAAAAAADSVAVIVSGLVCAKIQCSCISRVLVVVR
jgi:hypothetical protein